MPNATKLLFVGRIRPAVDDPAFPALRCADKDAAFALVAESQDDVIATLPGNQAPQQLVEFAGNAMPTNSFPLRVFFFCRDLDDHEWLETACAGEASGLGIASLELDPDNEGGECFVRVPTGIRTIRTRPVR